MLEVDIRPFQIFDFLIPASRHYKQTDNIQIIRIDVIAGVYASAEFSDFRFVKELVTARIGESLQLLDRIEVHQSQRTGVIEHTPQRDKNRVRRSDMPEVFFSGVESRYPFSHQQIVIIPLSVRMSERFDRRFAQKRV